MAKAVINPGACGFVTFVEVIVEGRKARINLESGCESIKKLALKITEADPYKDVSNRPEMSRILKLGAKYCQHAACPIPVGIIKTIEVAAKLAVPSDVVIKLSK